MEIIITDNDTGESITELIDLTGIDARAGEKKTVTINYKGDPNHSHHIKITFDDTCEGCDETKSIGCNDQIYNFDRNLKMFSVIIKNTDGKESFSEYPEDGVCPSETCVDSDFQ
ncbi:MAG: hypothetical protein HON47_02085 [Candidatus Diapherotrites archaeon]|jgi:hypothetical protein|uniref:Uncharacterized protein n=1 Tax=Candidatus Iainarchaeum sp. TaxID=3101447 RepID=A0A8T5GFM8_9ARCH|nr:hypothetical protein [Candidatus Diapherotrites archaeon]MBT7241369.1 hypothetical protein [Candidatus Diapherotrites archaeon]